MDHRQPTPVVASGPDGPTASGEPLHRATVPPVSAAVGFAGLFEATRKPIRLEAVPFVFPGAASVTPLGEMHCATARIDDHGRVSNRSAVRALEWAPGQNVSYVADGSCIRVQRVDHGRWMIGRDGYLHLPAQYRHMCNLHSGDQAVIAAAPEHRLLVVMPISVVAEALWNYRPQMWGVAA